MLISAPEGRPTPDWAWTALLLTGALWLAFCWTVLRIQPVYIAGWAGAAVLFGAACEAIRAVSGGRLWWLNAALATLFALTGAMIMADPDGSLTTPAALVGWYLIVRGAVDIVIATILRAAEADWGLMLTVGAIQTGLGFWASSNYSRTAEMLTLVVGGLALARGLADLTSALSPRSTGAFATTAAEAESGAESGAQPAAHAAGYVAGMADFADATARSGRARHRARASGRVDESQPADLDALLAMSGVSGAALGSTAQATMAAQFGAAQAAYAGPATGMSNQGAPDPAVTGAQGDAVRISPAAAAGGRTDQRAGGAGIDVPAVGERGSG